MTQDQNAIIRQERLNEKGPKQEFWRHLLAARNLLPEPLNEEGRFAKLEIFDDGVRRNSEGNALDTMECLADVNNCSPEFWEHLKAAAHAVETSPTLRRLSISPLLDDHPRNRNRQHISVLPLLSEKDRQVIEECLCAAVAGPFFPEWEFHTLIGLYRGEVSTILSQWPDVKDADMNTALAINNTMVNLLGYPHGKWEIWPNFVSVSPKEAAFVFHRWRQAKGWDYKSEEDAYFSRFNDEIPQA